MFAKYIKLFFKIKGVVLISGDVHLAEIMTEPNSLESIHFIYIN